MPIMTSKPSAPSPQQPTKPKIEPDRANSVIVDNSRVPLDSLITHVSGAALTVDYYRLVINKDNALYAQDVGQNAIQQQYILYKDLEIRQNGSWDNTQEDKDKVFSVRGSAIVHSGIIPNEGDMFVTNTGDGRQAVFNVTRSERPSILKDSIYKIEYVISYLVGNDNQAFTDLTRKVIQTYYYVKERIDYNDDPFLADDEYKFYRFIGSIYKEMQTSYLSYFFSKEFACFLVPGQTSVTFDYFIYKILQVLYRNDNFSLVQRHAAINIEDDDIIKRGNDIFTVLVERSPRLFETCERIAGFVRTDTYGWEGAAHPIRYTGIQALVYPKENEVRVDQANNRNTRPVLELPFMATPNELPAYVLAKEVTGYLVDNKEFKLIKPVSIDTCYVFSEAFYNEDRDNLSLIEVLTLDYINNRAINPAALRMLCDNYRFWPKLERFYYMPVIMILIQSLLKDL